MTSTSLKEGSSSPATGKRNDEKIDRHQPVLLTEVIEQLDIKDNGIYVDATFGRGGHSRAILARLGAEGRVYGLDRDHAAVEYARKIKDGRLQIRQGVSSLLLEWMTELGLVGEVNGILLDLGVSSPQLDDPQRGFSFLREGPLDMRMDNQTGISAAEWLAKVSEGELATVLREYGEERYSRRIAAAIVTVREKMKIATTTQLAKIVKEANPRWEKRIHPATRTFQAIRIFINNELELLQQTLEQAVKILTKGGRLLLISFHSLEDRIVKNFIKNYSKNKMLPSYIPVKEKEIAADCQLGKIGKVIRASQQEINNNPRARSAILRVAEKR